MITVEIRPETPKIDRYIKRAPHIYATASSEIAQAFAKFVRDNYLSGQVLKVRTGRTRKSVQAVLAPYKFSGDSFNSTYLVRPGIGIVGMLNYLFKFERGTRPFMNPALAAFNSSGAPEKIFKRVIKTLG